MNKELILKHKECFEHWLNGGNILVKYLNDTKPEWLKPDIEIPEDPWSFTKEQVSIVINDEYIKLRKALAEGKTVQYYVDSFAGWQDVTSIGNHSGKSVKEYRIKPEETKFKVGDWLKMNITGELIQAENDDVVYAQTTLRHSTIWEPEVGEWCWFWDYDKMDVGTARLAQYQCRMSELSYQDTSYKAWKHCEPFTGILPTKLQ